MECSTVLEALQVPEGSTIDSSSLYELFEQVTDGRAARGRRYSAALLLTIMVLAKLAGQRHLAAIAQWARLHADWLREELGLPRTSLPCANTYRYLSGHLELTELTAQVAAFFAPSGAPQPTAAVRPKRASTHLALDGKTLRGTRRATANQRAQAVVGLYDVTHQYMLDQREMAGKGQERAGAQALLAAHHLAGCLVSADALHTHPTWCEQVYDQGGDYLVVAKRNQPELRQTIALLFSQTPVPWLPEQQARTVSKGHGRLEVRHLRSSAELNAYLAPTWPHVAQVFQLTRTVKRQGTTTTELAYGLTSLPPAAAAPKRLLTLIQAHWQIENRVHWRRDVTLGEDADRSHTFQTPFLLALLNNVVLALMDHLHVANMAAQMRLFAARPAQALPLLTQPL